MTNIPARYAHCVHPYPVRHTHKVPFEPRISVPPDFGARASRIIALDRRLDRFILAEPDYFRFVQEAVTSNLHISVQLEGNPLTLEQVKRLTRDSLRGQTPTAVNPAQKEILNHLAVWFMPGELKLPWTVDTLRSVHASLMAGVDPGAMPGVLRSKPSGIYSNESQELFITAPPEHIQSELEALLDWLNLQSHAMWPVVAASVFFHEFESIHPFEEGNGRTGRVLFHAYLQNAGLVNAYRCLVEAELIRDPELYYLILGWTDCKGTYTELVDYFTDALLKSYEEAVNRYRTRDVTPRLDAVAATLVRMAKETGAWFTVRQAVQVVVNRSEQTVRNRLNELAEMQILHSLGHTRARRYRFADPLADVRARMAAERTASLSAVPNPPKLIATGPRQSFRRGT
jgi:Fic family protein